MNWKICSSILTITRPLIMGVVNVTPDSFSDGGHFLDPNRAVEHALQLIAEGADILDIGGESTRPGATPVSEKEELRRVVPVIKAIARKTVVPISIDTSKPVVARTAMLVGARIINDVSGLSDAWMIDVVQDFRPGAVVMHMQGTPQTMQEKPHYDDVVAEVSAFFESRLQNLGDMGMDLSCIALDPGIGFGKTAEHNWQLIEHLEEFRRFGRPIVLGVSRKRFLGPEQSPMERIDAGLKIARDVADVVDVIRTHDVKATVEAIKRG
jgi:dihydropteroate synthase